MIRCLVILASPILGNEPANFEPKQEATQGRANSCAIPFATRWQTLALLTIYSVITFQTGPFPALFEFDGPAVVFDTTTEYDPAEMPAMLEALGEEARALSVKFLLLDLLNPEDA